MGLYKPIHKMGDVLQVNIEGDITPCIVIKEYQKIHHLFDEPILLYNKPEMMPAIQSLNKKLIIGGWFNADITNCYQLLIGDKQVWLSYGHWHPMTVVVEL